MTQNNRAVGTRYENIASDFLTACGYSLLERNFRSRIGEIDIVASENDCICFVEVKYRKDLSSGFPAEAVTKTKQKKIIQTANYYLMTHPFAGSLIRFDVVEIVGDKIRLIRNAFGGI